MTKQKLTKSAINPRIERPKLTCIEENMFAKVLYKKPMAIRSYSTFKKLMFVFKERDYRSSTVKPMIKKLRNTAPSFVMLCEFADFIKIIEKVFFYYNDIRKSWTNDEGYPNTRILCDNKYDCDDEKIILIEMQREMTIIKLTMTREYNETTNILDEIVNVEVKCEFGKEVKLEYKIVNTEVEFTSEHDYNLMYNINIILQDAMADLFESYYNIIKN